MRAELEVYKKRNTGGRKKHDAAWNASYKDFIIKYEKGMSIMEIVAEEILVAERHIGTRLTMRS